MEIFNPHDKFFKETFSIRENVIDFLQGTFPEEILNKLDLSTLTLSNNSYIDKELKEHFEEEEGLRFLESVIRYLYNAPEIAVERVIDTIKEISEEGGKLSMTIATKLMEKGKIEGEKSLLIRQIERKWGRLQPNIGERLNKINTLEELEALGERVITAKCVEELFRNK